MAARRPFWKWRRWKSIGFCLWPPSTCIWNLKLKFQSKLDLCSGNHVVYRQTDGRMDGRTRWIQYSPTPTSLGGGINIVCEIMAILSRGVELNLLGIASEHILSVVVVWFSAIQDRLSNNLKKSGLIITTISVLIKHWWLPLGLSKPLHYGDELILKQINIVSMLDETWLNASDHFLLDEGVFNTET